MVLITSRTPANKITRRPACQTTVCTFSPWMNGVFCEAGWIVCANNKQANNKRMAGEVQPKFLQSLHDSLKAECRPKVHVYLWQLVFPF